MPTTEPKPGDRVLVTVFDSLETATAVAEALHSTGFPEERMELVVKELPPEASRRDKGAVRETTESAMIDSATEWGLKSLGAGAAFGLATVLLIPFPGVVLGSIFIGGLTGAITGGIAGVGRATHDDSINLPTLDEYRKLLGEGYCLLALHGTHEEVQRAKQQVLEMPHVSSHFYSLHGHRFHEHS